MKSEKLMDLLGNIDDDIFEKAIVTDSAQKLDLLKQNKKNESRSSMFRTFRWQKIGVIAACLIIVVCAVVTVPNKLNNQNSDSFTLTKSEGVTVNTVRDNIKISKSEASLVFLTEDELFDQAGYIFSGIVDKIDLIELNFNGNKEYKSLVTFSIKKMYKGSYSKSKIVIMTPPFHNVYPNVYTEGTEILSKLSVKSEGIFFARVYDDKAYWEECGSTLYLSEICPAGFGDGRRFGFIKNGDSSIYANESGAFSSLRSSNWNDVISYIEKFMR